jgi:predicted RNA-binding Zn ribbon-like protein
VDAEYPGPVRDEPISIELHNTLYAVDGEVVDGLCDERSATAWLAAIADRLPNAGRGRPPSAERLRALRQAVRELLRASVDGATPPASAVEVVNRHSAGVPRARHLTWRDGAPVAEWQPVRALRSDIVLAHLAGDAIDLVTSPGRGQIRACDAPGCVLAFVRHRTRREWCSVACGNRARQARHYHRSKR